MVIWSRIWIPDHLSTSHSIAQQGILGDLLAFLIQSSAAFYETPLNDWCQQWNESTTCWEQSGQTPSSLLIEATKSGGQVHWALVYVLYIIFIIGVSKQNCINCHWLLYDTDTFSGVHFSNWGKNVCVCKVGDVLWHWSSFAWCNAIVDATVNSYVSYRTFV